MKRSVFALMLLSAVFLLSSCSPDRYDDGYDDGYDNGYEEGYSDGISLGTKDGYDRGYQDGHDDGIYTGYQDGYEDGYDEASMDYAAVFEYAYRLALADNATCTYGRDNVFMQAIEFDFPGREQLYFELAESYGFKPAQ